MLPKPSGVSLLGAFYIVVGACNCFECLAEFTLNWQRLSVQCDEIFKDIILLEFLSSRKYFEGDVATCMYRCLTKKNESRCEKWVVLSVLLVMVQIFI